MVERAQPNRAARRRDARAAAARDGRRAPDYRQQLVELRADAEQWQLESLIDMSDVELAAMPPESIVFARAAMDGDEAALLDLELQTLLAVSLCTLWAMHHAADSREAMEEMLARTGHTVIAGEGETHFAIDRFDVFSQVMPILNHRVALIGLTRRGRN